MGKKGKQNNRKQANWLASNRICFFERKVNFTRLFVSQVSVNRNSENNNKLSCDSKSSSLLVLVD